MTQLTDGDFIQHMRQALTPVKRTGYEEIAYLYEQLVNRYEALAKQELPSFREHVNAVVALEAVSYILPYPIRKKLGLDHRVCERPELAMEIARNMLRLLVVPESHIDKASRREYLQMAKNGEDVYAYGNEASQIWNLWIIDTRVMLCLLAKQWRIIDTHLEPGGYWWTVTISPPDSEETYTRRLEVTPRVHDNDRVYPERARRVILDAVNHCAAFDINPCLIDGTHH
jgi:hypothetical protein